MRTKAQMAHTGHGKWTELDDRVLELLKEICFAEDPVLLKGPTPSRFLNDAVREGSVFAKLADIRNKRAARKP
jgi:hypothetical protein